MDSILEWCLILFVDSILTWPRACWGRTVLVSWEIKEWWGWGMKLFVFFLQSKSLRSVCLSKQRERVCFEGFEFRGLWENSEPCHVYPFQRSESRCSLNHSITRSLCERETNLSDIVWQRAGSNCAFGFQLLKALSPFNPVFHSIPQAKICRSLAKPNRATGSTHLSP